MNSATVKIEINSVSYHPVRSEGKTPVDHTYVTYLFNGKWGDLDIAKHTEDLEEIIELICEAEKAQVKNELLGEYEVEL